MAHDLYFEQGTRPAPRKAADDLSDLFLRRHALTVRCRIDAETGRLTGKQENTLQGVEDFAYRHDRKGHLTHVWRDGFLAEEYAYNGKGQRVKARRGGSPAVSYAYDESGLLARAGDDRFAYDKAGNLARRENGREAAAYTYEDTRLMRVESRYADPVRYAYDEDSPNPAGPSRKYRGDLLIMEFAWRDLLCLESCVNHELGLEYTFTYDARGALDRIFLKGFVPRPDYAARRAMPSLWPDMDAELARRYPDDRRSLTGLERLFGPGETEVAILCGCDQVNTPKLFTRYNGKLVKTINHDSFGAILGDSRPGLPVPVGFAGGLYDPDTVLVRFGYRDYDPGVGRFTCPDPVGDTGGDHDLYDYCVDDPVSLADKNGLKEKPFWRKLLEWYSPLVFMKEGDPEKEKVRKGINLVMAERVHGLGGGMMDIVKLSGKIPSMLDLVTLGQAPGPSEEQWKQGSERHKKRKADILREQKEYIEGIDKQ